MAKLTLFNGNQSPYNYNELRSGEYAVQNFNQKSGWVTLRYDGNDPFDVSFHAWELKFKISGLKTAAYERDDRGGVQIQGGMVTTFQAFNKNDKKLLEWTGLKGDAQSVFAMYEEDNGRGAWDAMTGRGTNTIVGSNNASGPSETWTGEDINTTRVRDIVNAGGGGDYIKDEGGRDTYNGGGGFDVVSYDGWFWRDGAVRGINADLAKGRIVGPDTYTDTVKSIEEVRGTFLNDVFRGNNKNNDFYGLGGRDWYDGKGGFDMISFRRDDNQGGADRVRVDLGQQTARDGFGNFERFKSIEAAQGTDYNDAFIDNGKDNRFDGRDGNDWFSIGRGNDELHLGDGADRIVFRGTDIGDNEVHDFEDAVDSIRFKAATQRSQVKILDDGNDTVIEFGSGSVRLFNVDSDDIGFGDLGL